MNKQEKELKNKILEDYVASHNALYCMVKKLYIEKFNQKSFDLLKESSYLQATAKLMDMNIEINSKYKYYEEELAKSILIEKIYQRVFSPEDIELIDFYASKASSNLGLKEVKRVIK